MRNCLFVLLLGMMTLAPSVSTSAGRMDSLDIKIGQMLMTGFRGTSVLPNSSVAKDIQELHLGGVVLYDFDVATKEYGRNITSPMQLQELTSQLQQLVDIPLFIAVDQEGGTVCRLKTKAGFPRNVSHEFIGTVNNGDTTIYFADLMARSMAIVGINVNFSPVVDLNLNSENPVIGKLGRSISADDGTVTRHASLMIDAFHNWGMLSAIKHFPGHGSSRDDSHLGFVDVSDVWSERELKPFAALIKNGMPDMVMTAHIFNRNLDEEWPATLSKRIIGETLRGELGFDGVVVSDDMMMKAIADHYGMESAIKLAVNAGVDILLFANNTYIYDPGIARKAFSILKTLVQNGDIPMDRINTSYMRIMQLKQALGTKQDRQ